MAIRVEHSPIIAPFAEAQYQAALRSRAQEDAQRRLQRQMQRLQMDAQRQGMTVQQQQADIANEQWTLQRAAMQQPQQTMPGQTMPGQAPGQGMAAPQADIPKNYADLMRTAMQQSAITERSNLRQAGEVDRMQVKHDLDLKADWMKRQRDLEAQDLELTMKDRRKIEEIFRGEAELKDAVMSGRINGEQFDDAYRQLQARLIGVEGIPRQRPPWPDEQDVGQTWMDDNTGALMTRDTNGNVKVLVSPPKEEPQRQLRISATAVRKRAEQIVQQRIQTGQLDGVVDAIGNIVDPEAYEQLIQEAMPEAHSQIAQEEQMTQGLNESFGQAQEEPLQGPSMPEPEQFQAAVSAMQNLPDEHKASVMQMYQEGMRFIEQNPDMAPAIAQNLEEVVMIYSAIEQLAAVDQATHRKALSLLESVFSGSPNAEQSLEQLKQILGV